MADRKRRDIVKWITSWIESNSKSLLGGHLHSKITWNLIFRVASYIKSSLWIVPIIAILLEQIVFRLLHLLDAWLVYPFDSWGLSGAEAMVQTVITLTLSFLVFTFGSLLVAIQVASGQLTPRIIATTLLRDKVVRYSVGLFVFSLIFAVGTIGRTEKTVHQFPVLVTGMLGLICMADFLYLIDYAARLLRPVSIANRVGKMGLAVIESVYPRMTEGQRPAKQRNLGTPERTIFHEGTGEIILAVNIQALVTEAEAAGSVIEFVPRVGDFLGMGEPLFRLYGQAAAIDERKLRVAVALGPERTMEQDPTFAFRILVDIALKALSPAINDPTTAVLMIDQLQLLLRSVGQRHLHDDEIPDAQGNLRLILRTPNWEDFVHLTFTEIRHCGASNVQIVRRLRALIQNLSGTLPEHRKPALDLELDLLNRTAEEYYKLPEDLKLVQIPDTQGL
jgi:uncharacterized membrane protein